MRWGNRQCPAIVVGELGWGNPPGITENSIAAFERAFELGADAVELDVRLTLDGVLAVVHDETVATGHALLRCLSSCTSSLEVARTNYSELPNHVLRLEQALDCIVIKHKKCVNIEIKNSPTEVSYDPSHRVATEVMSVVMAYECVDSVMVSTFTLSCLDRVKQLCPAICTAWLVVPTSFLSRDATNETPSQVLDRLLRHGHQHITPIYSMVTAEFMAEAEQRDVSVYVWAGRDEMNTFGALEGLVNQRVAGLLVSNVADARRAVSASERNARL